MNTLLTKILFFGIILVVAEAGKGLPLEELVIKIPNYRTAPTTGWLTMKIRQGENECQTNYPTWKGVPYPNRSYFRKPIGCPNTFDPDLPFDLWLTNPRKNDPVWIDRMGVKIGGKWHYWRAEDHGEAYEGIAKEINQKWHTTSYSEGGSKKSAVTLASAVIKNTRLPLEELVIKLPNYYHAPTTGWLTMKIRQGENECRTSYPTWKGVHYPNRSYFRKPIGCPNTFNPDLPFDLWLTNTSGNDVWIDRMGVKIGGKWHYWKAEDHGEGYEGIDKYTKQKWLTTSD